MSIWSRVGTFLQHLETAFFDPSILNDDFALTVDRGPAKGGGSSFVTARLTQSDVGQYYFRATTFAYIFMGLFALVGLIWLIVSLVLLIKESRGIEMIGFFAAPLIFLGLSGYFFVQYYYKSYTVDPLMKRIYQGRPPKNDYGIATISLHSILFEDVYALQIIAESIKSKDSRYVSYELNLVLKDATRINLVDHGGYEQLREDADTLSNVLGVVLRDTVSFQE